MAVADLSFGREEVARPQEDSQRQMIWRRFRKHRLAVVGVGMVFFLCLFSYLGPILSPYSPTEMLDPKLKHIDTPLFSYYHGFHLLGLDHASRDYLTRLMYGGQVS